MNPTTSSCCTASLQWGSRSRLTQRHWGGTAGHLPRFPDCLNRSEMHTEALVHFFPHTHIHTSSLWHFWNSSPLESPPPYSCSSFLCHPLSLAAIHHRLVAYGARIPPSYNASFWTSRLTQIGTNCSAVPPPPRSSSLQTGRCPPPPPYILHINDCCCAQLAAGLCCLIGAGFLQVQNSFRQELSPQSLHF